MKKNFILILLLIFLTSCFYNDPLYLIRRKANSANLQKMVEASYEYKEAIDLLVKAYSSYAGLNKEIANKLIVQRNFKQAAVHLELAKEYKSNDSTIYYWLGICYSNLYKTERDPKYLLEANKNYEISININPKNKEVLYGYAQYLVFIREDYIKAIDILKQNLLLIGKNFHPETYFLLARAYYMAEDYENAYKIYNEIYNNRNKLNNEQKNKLNEFIEITRKAMNNE